MKKTLIIMLSTLLCSCGISETEYNKVVSQRDSLQLVANKLEQEVDVLRNGEERLMNYIMLYNDNDEYVKAFDNLNSLRKYHPESSLLKKHKVLFASIEQKATLIIDSIAKAKSDSIKLANINNLGKWQIGNFVNDFDEPTGEHFVCSEFYGTFSNSATAGSKLRVYVRAANYSSREFDYSISLRFDEYDNGTYEDEKFTYRKIVNKESRKVYKNDSPYSDYYYDENRNGCSLEQIFREEGVYEFEMRLEYGTRYAFKIDTRCLNNALVKAGLKSIDDL